MTDWPIHYPDRPAIPHDTTSENSHAEHKRSQRRYAEAGHRRVAPVRKILVRGRTDTTERPGERT